MHSRSMFPRPLKMWFLEVGDVLLGHLNTGQETTLNGYQGHVFVFTEEKHSKEIEVARFTLVKETVLYVIRPQSPGINYSPLLL